MAEEEILKIVLSILLAFLIAQTSKVIIDYQKNGQFDWRLYFKNGGMPSSHTSSVMALTTAILIETGLSYYFIICLVFAIIIMNDAIMVRREVGLEAEMINKVLAKENIIHHKLTESVGHTPLQVTIGFFVGIICALAVYAFF
ncbi:MAG: divergent PAP2 family protein [archaeon]